MTTISSINSLTGNPIAGQNYADAIIGPMLIGSLLNVFLFAIALQAYFNYSRSPLYRRDSTRTNLLFWIVCVFGLFEAGLNAVEIYRFGVSQRRDVISLVASSLIADVQPAVSGVVALSVQSFLAHRAGTLFVSKVGRKIFHAVVGLGILAAFVGAICVSAVSFSYTLDRAEALEYLSFNQAVAIWTWSSASVDIAITFSLFLTLRKHIVGFNQEMDNIVIKLIRLGFCTALPATCLALAAAIASLTFKTTNFLTCSISSAFFFPLPSLYCLSLITTLSYREILANHSGFVPPSITSGKSRCRTFLTLHPVPKTEEEPTQPMSFSNVTSPVYNSERGRITGGNALQIMEERWKDYC